MDTAMLNQLRKDIEGLPGVHSVYVRYNASGLSVNVFMEELEIESFSPVAEKELELFGRFPDSPVNFTILPKEALEDMSFDSLHAA